MFATPRLVGRAGLPVLGLTAMLGCPTPVEHRYGERTPRPVAAADENDPRVVKDGEDLYAAAAVEKVERRRAGDEPEDPKRGSGKPDESNGQCRLFAPKLPSPKCCPAEFGFDVETVRSACNLELYLGESWHNTCGYYFHLGDGTDTWFRASFITAQGPKAAAESQARQINRQPGVEVAVQKVPGTKDAWWLRHEDLGWAYFGEWERVRQFAWTKTACNDRGLAQVIAKMEAAKEPGEGAKRLGLLPKAR